MTFGTTTDKPWVEALQTERGASFTGRTFSRFHIIGDSRTIPAVGEIWATSDHAVQAHAHESDELLYVLSGAIEINGRRLDANEVAFIPKGTAYSARVLTGEGSHVLRVEMPNGDRRVAEAEYEAKIWQGSITEKGVPYLDGGSE